MFFSPVCVLHRFNLFWCFVLDASAPEPPPIPVQPGLALGKKMPQLPFYYSFNL